MELALFLGLGLFASVWSLATLPRTLDDITRVIAASIALFSWALIAIHATNIEVHKATGSTVTTVTNSYLGVTWLATALALIMLLFAVWRTYRTFQR